MHLLAPQLLLPPTLQVPAALAPPPGAPPPSPSTVNAIARDEQDTASLAHTLRTSGFVDLASQVTSPAAPTAGLTPSSRAGRPIGPEVPHKLSLVTKVRPNPTPATDQVFWVSGHC